MDSDWAVTGMDACSVRRTPARLMHLRDELAGDRERASADYEAAEQAMTDAAKRLADCGVHAASPAQLRAQNTEYLARLAAIVRSGAENPDQVLALAAGGKSGVSWG